MIALNLPKADFRFRREGDGIYVFDALRRRYVKFTPEEYVRQSFVNFLVVHKGYPRGLMNNEVAIEINSVKLRCDTIVYDRDTRPLMIVEYKAPTCAIDEAVLRQAYVYNMALRAHYLVLSNGLAHHCFHVDYVANEMRRLDALPDYQDLCLNV